MKEAGRDEAEREAIAEAARGWFVRMRGSPSRAQQQAHEAWLVASLDHRRAYERVRRSFAETALLKSSRKFGTPFQPIAMARPHRRWIGTGSAIAAALLLAVVGSSSSLLPQWLNEGTMAAHAAEPFRTARGEIRRFELADGSSLVLDTDSEAEVTLSGNRRHLRLIRGRARLFIASEGRPFEIATDHIQLASHDATIDLALASGGQVELSVARGSARLRSAAGAATRTLGAGVSARLVAGKRLELAAGSPRTPGDWPSGWAEHRRIALGQLIADANRYAERPIRLDVPSLADEAMSGRFHISDPDSVAAGIALLYDLRLVERADALHLVRK